MTTSIFATDLYQATMREAHAVASKWQHDIWTSPYFLKGCESPLEAAWRVWWSLATNERRELPFVVYQHPVTVGGQSYRLDVALLEWTSGKPVIAVELDGHTFHERTPEQVIERDARDRALQSAGWVVLHFSYSEITTRGLECAVEALERFDALVAPQARTA